MAKDTSEYDKFIMARINELKEENIKLHLENSELRQQRDAANAQIDFLIEEMKKAP